MIYTDTKCKNNNWLHKQSTYWTLSPSFSNNNSAFYIFSLGTAHMAYTYISADVFPSLYLSSNVSISSGNGSASNPYVLSI